MDKTAVKTVLSAWRPADEQEEDSLVAEALREVEKDPELAAWFEEAQRFDARMVATLKGVSAPAGLKELLLSDARPGGDRPFVASVVTGGWKRRYAPWLAMTAVFVFAFVLGRLTNGLGENGSA